MTFREKAFNATSSPQSKPEAVFRRIIAAGTTGIPMEKANRIIVVNSLCLATALLAAVFSLIIFMASRDYGVLVAGLGQMLFFSSFIWCNKKGWYPATAWGYLLLHNITLFYFAVIREMVVEERLLLVYLIVCSLLVLGRFSQIAISVVTSISILIFAKMNMEMRILPTHPMQQQAAGPFHELGTIALIILILVAVGHFKWQDLKFIAALRERNENLEEEVKQRTRELKNANENIRFFYNQHAHDLRDKLFGLKEINNLLIKAIPNPKSEAARLVQRQHGLVSSLTDMIHDVLTLRMIETGKYNINVPQTIDTRAWFSQLVDTAQVNADLRQVTIHLSMEKKLPAFIKIDPVKVDKILSNLLANAIRHTRSFVVLKVADQDQHLLIEVVDKGPGIPMDNLSKIFDKNYSTGTGTGLGLYIVRWLCDLLKIELKVDSTLGKGTKFYLRVPYALGNKEDITASAEELVTDCDFEGQKILICDDSWDNRFILRKNLEAVGANISEASNGAEMLAMARAVSPNLIILDNKMEIMSGTEALSQLKADSSLQHIPVIMMTASAPQLEILDVQADDFLVKPLKMEKVLISASRLLHPASQTES